MYACMNTVFVYVSINMVCVYVCMYAHACTHACMHACMYVCMHACMHVYTRARMHAGIDACMQAGIDTHMHAGKQKEHLPAVHSGGRKHGIQPASKVAKCILLLAVEELNAQDGVHAHDEQYDHERIRNWKKGLPNRRDDLANFIEAAKETEHPEGPQQAHAPDCGGAAEVGKQRNHRHGHYDKVKDVPRVLPKVPEPMCGQVDDELNDKDDRERQV